MAAPGVSLHGEVARIRAEQLATVETMYREMDMRFWVEQAEAEMKELEPLG